MIITPIRVIPLSFENFDPLKKISWVTTAPTLPPPPVIPDITPNDLNMDVYICTTLEFITELLAECYALC